MPSQRRLANPRDQMMTLLWHKELRTVRPYLGLTIFLGLVDFSFSLITEFPDQLTLAEKLDGHFREPMTYSLFYLFLSFSLASLLLMREYDDGALEFLDALPVTRAQVFVAKYFVAVAVISVFPLLELISYLPLHALGRESIDQSFRLPLLATLLFLHVAQILVFSAAAFLLAYLRRFAWVLLGLLYWIYQALKAAYPKIAALDPFDLIALQTRGDSLRIPWNLLGPQLLLAGAMWLGSFFLFTGWGDGLATQYHRLKNKAGGNAVLILSAVAIVIMTFAIIVHRSPQESEGATAESEKNIYPNWKNSTAASTRCDFVYPANLEERTLRLVRQADSVRGLVEATIGDTLDRRIFVDMTRSYSHYAGTANWLTVNLDLAANPDLDELRATFAHELTHVYIDAISNRRLAENFAYTRFFHEGLASYVEYKKFHSAADHHILRLIAAAMRSRREVDFERLVNDAQLTAQQDGNLVYPLGERFVQALVNKYGERAPAKTLRSFADPDLNLDLHGVALWRQVLQNAGYSLESVWSEFFRLLDADAARFALEIRALPRIQARLEINDAALLITPSARDLPAGWRLIGRLRANAGVPYRDYLIAAEQDGQFVIDRANFGDNRCECQLGLTHLRTGHTIYEPWFAIDLAQ